jgi:predicted GNAT superfamily acetyltransferase
MNSPITDVSIHDLDAVLALNQSEVPPVGEVGVEDMRWFSRHADYFRIIRSHDRLAAFLIALRPGSDYRSPNYRWFCDRYEDFAYIDRVAVGRDFRRQGLASRLYADLGNSLPKTVPLLTCEVNVEPPNPASMRFHENLGFEIVGEQALDGASKVVAMLAKAL